MLPALVWARLVADAGGRVASSENALVEDGRNPPVALLYCKGAGRRNNTNRKIVINN